MSEQRRDRNRWGQRDEAQPQRQEPRRDAGAYIGRMPERATETIPGGVGPKDVRVSATATQPGPVGGDTRTDAGTPPEGHREGAPASDAAVREAGQNR
jgi:hypothetical protein